MKPHKKIILIPRLTFIVLLTVLLGGIGRLHAQTLDTSAIFTRLKDIKLLYSGDKALSFYVNYTYSNETHPEIILDTLSGFFEMQKGNYHSITGNVETFKTDDYFITLFKEDSLMYISKPVSSTPEIIALTDSALLHTEGMKWEMSSLTGQTTILLQFPAGMAYKSIEVIVDDVTGFILKTNYLVKTELLTDPGTTTNEIAEAYDKYARVETVFSGYKNSVGNEKVFLDSNFFYKNGKEYKPTEAFKNYSIFLGSPGL